MYVIDSGDQFTFHSNRISLKRGNMHNVLSMIIVTHLPKFFEKINVLVHTL